MPTRQVRWRLVLSRELVNLSEISSATMACQVSDRVGASLLANLSERRRPPSRHAAVGFAVLWKITSGLSVLHHSDNTNPLTSSQQLPIAFYLRGFGLLKFDPT